MKLILSLIFAIFGVLLWFGSPVDGAGSCPTVPKYKGPLCIQGNTKSCTDNVFKEIIDSCKLEPGYVATCINCAVCKTGIYKDCCEIKKGASAYYYTNNGPEDVIIMPQ
uniref:Uncharacterized protein n=1 Tax=Cacopsylla melanoneura TaxID=428564 RepID=A0A8D8USE5_9HEMI